jgi:hypothetical protein
MGFLFDFVLDCGSRLLGDSVVAKLGKEDLPEFDCSLRVIAGRQEGLSHGWRDGHASVYPGGLDFEAFHANDGLRAALGLDFEASSHANNGFRAGLRTSPPPISVTVDAVATARQRQPNDEEAEKVNTDSQIVELTTCTATLEWAVPTNRLKEALERVQSSWPSEVPSA